MQQYDFSQYFDHTNLKNDFDYIQLNNLIDEAKEYVNNCNADIELIIEARNRAINDANDAINNYNLYH